MVEMSIAQKSLAVDLVSKGNTSNDIGGTKHKFQQSATIINDSIFADFENTYRTTVLEPIELYCSYLPDFAEAISKAKKRQSDLDRTRSQLSKAANKSANDQNIMMAGENSVEYAEHAFQALHDSLVQEIPKLINARIFIVEPAFKSLVKLQIGFFLHCLEELSRVNSGQPSVKH
ncbi:hypothetical protein BB560_002761 [Smittium megazygosporum]|uniref:BAR domain-containing protein n=1 Tax=Smittium megazygosporum TaxID=133381 RepID=A0A2T9ZDU0_9FUNG|nr:hypothetical protein BB560_002761 [Smittium megazygosporum]